MACTINVKREIDLRIPDDNLNLMQGLFGNPVNYLLLIYDN